MAIVAAKLEDCAQSQSDMSPDVLVTTGARPRPLVLLTMGLEFDNVDGNVATAQRSNASSSIDRVLILKDLDDSVLFVRRGLVSAQVIKIEPIRLAALARHHTDTPV